MYFKERKINMRKSIQYLVERMKWDLMPEKQSSALFRLRLEAEAAYLLILVL